MKNHKPTTLRDIEKVLQDRGLVVCSQIKGNKEFQGKITTSLEGLDSGDLYLAYKGVSFDGNSNISQAFLKNPNVVIGEAEAQTTQNYIQVRNGREAWSWTSATVFGNPQNDFTNIGVTGTNGKTSTTWLIRSILKQLGVQSILFGTMGIFVGEEYFPSNHTTPDPPKLFEMLNYAKSKNIKVAIYEVSSHALAQFKLVPIKFDYGVFTSFSRDHLDYHKSLEDYWNVKCSFFKSYLKQKSRAFAHESLSKKLKGSGFTNDSFTQYGRQTSSIKEMGDKVNATVFNEEISFMTPMIGEHSLCNLLASLLVCCDFTNTTPSNAKSLTNQASVPGRLELIKPSKDKPKVFVDYAHTPEALEKALFALKEVKGPNKLWVVFGCGGNRDKGKRPIMGATASKLSDNVIITNDNPRNEEAEQIANDILKGVPKEANHWLILNRKDAIHFAIASAKPSDYILVAGKGHENTQIINNKSIPFSDREVCLSFLSEEEK